MPWIIMVSKYVVRFGRKIEAQRTSSPMEINWSEDVKALKNHLGPLMVSSDPRLLPRTMAWSVYLPEPWSCRYLWPLLPPRVIRSPRVRAVICSPVGVKGPCHSRGYPYLVGLGCCLDTSLSLIWSQGPCVDLYNPTTARACADVHGSCHHQGSCKFPESWSPLWVILRLEGLPEAGVMLIRRDCSAIWATMVPLYCLFVLFCFVVNYFWGWVSCEKMLQGDGRIWRNCEVSRIEVLMWNPQIINKELRYERKKGS